MVFANEFEKKLLIIKYNLPHNTYIHIHIYSYIFPIFFPNFSKFQIMEHQTKDALIARIKALAIEYKTLRAAPMGKPKNEGAQEAANIGEAVAVPEKEATAKGGGIGDEAKSRKKIEQLINVFKQNLAAEQFEIEKIKKSILEKVDFFKKTGVIYDSNNKEANGYLDIH